MTTYYHKSPDQDQQDRSSPMTEAEKEAREALIEQATWARADLRAKAEAATKHTTGNRWLEDTGGIVLDPDRAGNDYDGTIVCTVPTTEDPRRRRHLRDYIAAANPAVVLELLDALEVAEARATEAEAALNAVGSCWDHGPKMIVPEGECAPEPPLCELPSGHPGAHRGGNAEWMHRDPFTVGVERDAEKWAALARAREVIETIRASAVELLDADDDSYDGSLSAIWVVEMIATYEKGAPTPDSTEGSTTA